MTGREELELQVEILKTMVKENPCQMGDSMLRSLAHGLKAVMSERLVKGLSRCQVARYLGVSERTLDRWRKEYDDFPQPRHDGHLEVSYPIDKVVEWKIKMRNKNEKI